MESRSSEPPFSSWDEPESIPTSRACATLRRMVTLLRSLRSLEPSSDREWTLSAFDSFRRDFDTDATLLLLPSLDQWSHQLPLDHAHSYREEPTQGSLSMPHRLDSRISERKRSPSTAVRSSFPLSFFHFFSALIFLFSFPISSAHSGLMPSTQIPKLR